MQKLRPYVLPGLFVFHLVVLCSVILAGPTESLQPKFKDTSPLEMLVFVTVCCTLGSQWILTGLWAGWGTHPWVLRVPSCAALATLIWISGSVVVQRVSEDVSRPIELERALLTMFPAWFFLVTALLCFRYVPALRWQLTLRGSNAGLRSRPRAHSSLTRGILIVVAGWAGVLVLLKDSQPWPVWESQTLRITSTDQIGIGLNGIVTGLCCLAPLTIIVTSFTLTPLADWIIYRRPRMLPLIFILPLGLVISSLLGGVSLAGVVWGVLLLLVQPTATLLVLGQAGYRIAFRRSQPENDACISTSTGTDALSFESLRAVLRGPHVAVVVAFAALFGALVPTGILSRYRLVRFPNIYKSNDSGQITALGLGAAVTDSTLRGITNFVHLKELNLNNTQATDAGLVHLKGLTNLEGLSLNDTQVTDAGLVHLKELTTLQFLNLRNIQVTDAGLVHLQGLTNLKELVLPEQTTDAGLVHLKGLINLQKLALGKTQVTDAGVAELQQALPNCKIEN